MGLLIPMVLLYHPYKGAQEVEREIGDFIRENTKETDKIFGPEGEYYYLSNRGHGGYPKQFMLYVSMLEQYPMTVDDFRQGNPIIVVDDPMAEPYPPEIMDYIKGHYEPIKVFSVYSDYVITKLKPNYKNVTLYKKSEVNHTV